METIIDNENKTISIYNDEGERISSIFLYDGHAIWEKVGDEDIILDENSSSAFYENLRKLFDNNYSFAYRSGNQAENYIEFYSDELHPVNLESLNDLNKRSRLVLKLDHNKTTIKITIDNPSDQEEAKKRRLIFINPANENTFGSVNDSELPEYDDTSLQKDIVDAISKSFITKSYLPGRLNRLRKRKSRKAA